MEVELSMSSLHKVLYNGIFIPFSASTITVPQKN